MLLGIVEIRLRLALLLKRGSDMISKVYKNPCFRSPRLFFRPRDVWDGTLDACMVKVDSSPGKYESFIEKGS